MKKVLMVFTVLMLVGTIGGVLYTTIAKLDAVEEMKQEYASTNPFPYEMPEVVMYPGPNSLPF